MARFWPKWRYNGRVMAREVFFHQCLWVTKFCAKFGRSRIPRTARDPNSFIVLRCMWKEPAPLRLKMSFFALWRLKNHKVPHLHPNSTMFMPLERLQLKIYAFSGKFNVCSNCVLLSWIKNCRDFTLQTQIFTQKYRSWLRFYSEFLRKNLAAGVSVLNSFPS